VRDVDDPTHAELAITVLDRWQGRGLGRVLLDAVADRARDEGITCLTAEVLSENRPMLGLLRRAGPVTLDREGDTTIAHLEL
jgi:GNAT superfamily N-acetyltransferase